MPNRYQTASIGARIAATTLCLLGIAGAAHSADCVQAKPGSTSGAPIRDAPNKDGAELSRLQGAATLSLVATMPGWYETHITSGAAGFVSKAATRLVPCPTVVATGPEFELHAIDVGTGLAILVRGPDFTLLYDAGTNDDLARGADNRVVAYLKTLVPKITSIDNVFLSHPHRDHVELLADVFAAVDVKDVWNSGAYNNICGYRAFLNAVAHESGVKYHTAIWDAVNEPVLLPKKECYGVAEPQRTLNVPHSDRINTEEEMPLGHQGIASMRILYANGSERPSFNENSLVVRLKLGTHTVLFMGDAEAGGRKSPTTLPTASSIEGKLLACCIDVLKADVLVAGHHGSKTSSRDAFLDAVGAKLYLVSSGPTKYASVTLPDTEVVSDLEGRGEVFRTDLDDDQCAIDDDKIGPDHDGKPGGCSNIVVSLPSGGLITARYQQATE